MRPTVFRRRTVLASSLVITALLFAPIDAQKKADLTDEWRSYGGSPGSTKYSPLDQINKHTAANLKIAWTWESPDVALQLENRALGSFAYEATPLMIGGTLYTSTSLSQVAAINPQTGKTIWTFDPESYKAGRPTNLGFVNRGLAYWADGSDERIYIATGDAHLWAIDAKTGKAVTQFGEAGKVNLAKAIPKAINARNYAVSSPPVICRDVIIVGSSISDGPANKEAPRGDVQAFDVRTGKALWVFHSIPQEGEFGNETWENESWRYTGNTNVWSLISTDEELGYVYLPFGTPTNDWYGGHRLGSNLFAESLVCLDARNGKRVWHFQTVHHGLWDYDLPAAPVLCEITVGGRRIKAVAQITKSGFTFVFDRQNGKPVWPIEERPVPQSKLAGERTSPTQPIPTRPAPFERQGSTEDNLIDFTPQLRADAKRILEQFEHGPLFTPPSEKGTINLPGWTGGANWWGAAFDPQSGILYVPSVSAPIVVKLVKPDAARSNFNYVRGASGAPGTMGGTLEGPNGLPLFKPPYGRITAINLNTGEHVWMVPNGDGQRKRVSEVVGKDVGPLGAGGTGPLLTKSVLILGQGMTGRGPRGGGEANVLRVFDKVTGKVIVEHALPAVPTSTPMTYMAGGKQYIVIATVDAKLVALSL